MESEALVSFRPSIDSASVQGAIKFGQHHPAAGDEDMDMTAFFGKKKHKFSQQSTINIKYICLYFISTAVCRV